MTTVRLVLDWKLVGFTAQNLALILFRTIAALARETEVRPLIREPVVAGMPGQFDAIHRDAELGAKMVYIEWGTGVLCLAIPALVSAGIR
jgi:hypothetical protein